MRTARNYIGGAFWPASSNDVIALLSAGCEKTAYILQVYGYWDMVAALVFHGALHEDLVYDACPEMYFQFAKIAPYLEQVRERLLLPHFCSCLQRFITGSEKGQARLRSMEQHVALLQRRSD